MPSQSEQQASGSNMRVSVGSGKGGTTVGGVPAASQTGHLPQKLVQKTKSQLMRHERVQLFGLDCVDNITISGQEWYPGKEVLKKIIIKNVSLTTQKITYTLPTSEVFGMDFPAGWALAPGATCELKLYFRPIIYQPYVDYVTVQTPTGEFSILIKALVNDTALSVPGMLDFG